jgi:hypothetical protein
MGSHVPLRVRTFVGRYMSVQISVLCFLVRDGSVLVFVDLDEQGATVQYAWILGVPGPVRSGLVSSRSPQATATALWMHPGGA